MPPDSMENKELLFFLLTAISKIWGESDKGMRLRGSAGKMDKEGVGNEVIADGRWEKDRYSKGKSYDRMAPKGQSQPD